MNFLNIYLRRTLELAIIVLLTVNVSAQSWVDSMLDPNANFYKTQRLFNEYFKDKEYEKGKGWKQFKRWEYFMQSRIDEDGKFTHINDTYKEYQKVQNFYATARLGQGVAGNWTSLGPNGASANGGGAGRINCYAFHPNDANYILAGAASGGIWISTNGGSLWKTYTDNLGTLGISSIAFSDSSPNVVYAATGDLDGTDTYSIGVIKSTDGGKHWNSTALSYSVLNKRLVYKVIVHPTNKDIVYATTNVGIYKTTDGGLNWTRIKIGAYNDMVMKPGDPNTLYFAKGKSILRTTDGGQTFNFLSLYVSSANRMVLAVTPDDPNYLYALTGDGSNNGFGGVYLSTDGGNTFTTKATSPNLLGWDVNGSDAGGQAWYDLSIAVLPTNKNMVFVGGVNIWKSTNGGSNWTCIAHWYGAQGKPYVHADIHRLVFSPHSNSNLWAATDGGVFQSTNNGSSWVSNNSGLQVGQIYRLGSSKTNPKKIMTGWQDNGSSFLNGTQWYKVLGGDGMECIIDYNNNDIMYGSLYYGKIRRSANGGISWTEITNSIPEQGNWVTPYVMHPTNPNILFAAYVNVYKSTNKGTNWTKISNFSGGNKIRALAVAPSNPNVIYIAYYNSVYKTTDGGNSWTSINSALNNITYFAIDPTNENRIWASIGGFSSGGRVIKSTNGGANWTDISDSLPGLPVNCIVYEKNSADGLYIGTDIGVYYRDNNLNRWVPFMKGLPNVIVKELEIYYPTNKIRAATYGRSVWESDLYPFATSISQNNNQKQNLKIYPNPAQNSINIDMNGIMYKEAKIRVLNSIGEEVILENNVNSTIILISVKNLNSGIYFIEIQTETDVYYGKFIKQ